MKQRAIQKYVVAAGAALVAGLAACGGGAGGGSVSAKQFRRSGGREGVRVLHAAIDCAPYSLSSAAVMEPLQRVKFSLPAEYAEISEGAQILTAGGAPDCPAFTFPVADIRAERQSLLVYGSLGGSGVGAALLADDAGEIPGGMSAVRVVNGADELDGLSAAAGAAAIADGLALGGGSPYAYVPSGPQEIVLRGARGGVFYRGLNALEEGKAYTVFAAGEADYLILVRVLED